MSKLANKMFKQMAELDDRMRRYRRRQIISEIATWAALLGVIGFLVFALMHCDGAAWETGDYRTEAPWNYEGDL